MANTKSAKKSILVNERNRKRNLHFKSKMKGSIKISIEALTSNDKDKESIIRETLKTIDKSASKNIIHKNTAARKKSAIAKLFNESKNQKAPVTTKKETNPTVETKSKPAKKTVKSAANKEAKKDTKKPVVVAKKTTKAKETKKVA